MVVVDVVVAVVTMAMLMAMTIAVPMAHLLLGVIVSNSCILAVGVIVLIASAFAITRGLNEAIDDL